MITLSLSDRTRALSPMIKDLLIYSGIQNLHVEIGKEQQKFGSNVLFIDESKHLSLEDVIADFALRIYNSEVHKKCLKSTEVAFVGKFEDQAHIVASVLEKAVEPVVFLSLR